MSQQKQEDSGHTFLCETLGSVVLDCGASEIVCGTKWCDFFLKTITEKQIQTIKVQDRVRIYKFGDRNKHKSPSTVTQLYVIAGNESVS